MTSNWYVLRIKSRSEASVANELERDGYNCFLPQVKGLRRNKIMALAPLFPGYLFLQVEIRSSGAELARNRKGVLGWLRTDDNIPFIAEETIANIRRQVTEINGSGGLWKRFRPGDKVRVVSGKLDSPGKVTGEPDSAQGNVRVTLHLMGRTITARVPLHTLQPVNEQPRADSAPRRSRRTRGRGRWINSQAAVGAAQT